MIRRLGMGAAVIATAVLISSCAGFGVTSTSRAVKETLTPDELRSLTIQNRFALAVKEWDEIKDRADYYSGQPWCTPGVLVMCADEVLVDKIGSIVKRGDNMVIRAQALSARSPTGDPGDLSNAQIRALMGELNLILVTKGV